MTKLASIILLVCLCASCKTYSPGGAVSTAGQVVTPKLADAARNPAPALPQSLSDIPQRSVAKAVQSPQSLVPSPPKPLMLTWDYDPSRRWEVSHFRVYSNTSLAPAPWPLWVTTTNQFITFLPTNTSRFFYCTAFGVNGKESLPNTK